MFFKGLFGVIIDVRCMMGDFFCVFLIFFRGDYVGKLIESVVDCFYKIIFYWFIGVMNDKFLIN